MQRDAEETEDNTCLFNLHDGYLYFSLTYGMHNDSCNNHMTNVKATRSVQESCWVK